MLQIGQKLQKTKKDNTAVVIIPPTALDLLINRFFQ